MEGVEMKTLELYFYTNSHALPKGMEQRTMKKG
jgi:hypothetical protein